MFKVLLKKQLSEVFKGYFYDAKRNQMRSKRAIAAWFAFFVVVVFGMLGGMFAALSIALCDSLVAADAGWFYFAVMTGFAVLFGTFGAVFNSYSSLYLARDNGLLLALPVPVRTIVASRLTSAYLLGLLYSAVALVPALVVYWVVAHPGLTAVACGIALLLIASLIVMCLSCLLGWVVARISLKLKNKSIVTVLIVIAGIALYYFSFFQARSLFKDLIVNAAAYGASVKDAAFGLYVFGSIGEGSVSATALFLLISLALFVLVWELMSRNYLATATATGKVKETRYVEKEAHQKSPFRAMISKELAKFLSSPNYMLNSGLGILFMVVVGIAMLLNGQVLNEMVVEVWGDNPAQACVLLSGVLCLLAASNDIAAPSVSLEGKSIWMLQSLPVEPRSVLRAKAAMHFALTVVPLAFVTACFAAVVDLPLAPKLAMCLAPFACAAFTTTVASSLGVKMANLSWTNEIAPIKQSAAATISMFGGWGVAVVLGGLYFIVGGGIDATLYLATWTVLFIALAACLLRWLDTKGARAFAEL